MGHSRGGNQVAWYAAERPEEEISKVVLLAPATGASMPARDARYRARFGADLPPLLAKAKSLIANGEADTMMRVPGFLYCRDVQVRAASMVSIYGPESRRDTPVLIPRIGQAVLVIAGSADEVVPDVAARVRPLADGKRVRLEVIEDAGHMFLNFFAEDVADLVAEFVTESGG
jgi:pimeloyl-ACP methyl ester carboxylesterase